MRILLLGVNGQVGWMLARSLAVLGDLITTARGPGATLQLDVGDLTTLEATLDSVAPDVIVNAAAYTAVDQAESEPEAAMRINGEVPGVLGAWAARRNALVLHYSTDYVFDGTKDGPYVESDAPAPISSYGRSKLAGDDALLDSGCDAIILRVGWVYGLRGNNFLLTMRRLMAERDELGIVDDQTGAPTWSGTIAQGTAAVLARLPAGPDARSEFAGVYHFAPSGHTTWHGFASAIREIYGIDCTLHPIPTSDYPTPAQRPSNSRLDSRKIELKFRLRLPQWHSGLELCCDT